MLTTYGHRFSFGAVSAFDSFTHEVFLSNDFYATDGPGTRFETMVVYDGETRIDTVSWPDDPQFGEYVALHDGNTGLTSLAILLSAYGSIPGNPNWNPACGFDGDNDVDLAGLGFLLADYGCGA